MTVNFHFLQYSLLEHDGLISCKYEGCQKSSWTPMIIASNEPYFDIHYYISLK